MLFNKVAFIVRSEVFLCKYIIFKGIIQKKM